MLHTYIESVLTPLGLMDPVARLATILLAPLAAATLIALFCRRSPRTAITLSVGAAFIIMALSLSHLLLWDGLPIDCAWTLFSIGGFDLHIGFNFDGQAALLLFVVSFVGFWIHLFSVGYMDDDAAPARFFGGLSIFMFSMLGIVFSDNLFMLFIFWELVGFSSYMLIAHYFTTEDASNAAKKAFIVNRVGDVGFLLGILWAYQHFGTVNLGALKSAVSADPTLVKAGIAFCLMAFCAVWTFCFLPRSKRLFCGWGQGCRFTQVFVRWLSAILKRFSLTRHFRSLAIWPLLMA
ncbi:MAG: hypothetical protein B7X06_04560 [Verrucomicrobia bacterium 21-51-4]|nr:MAG: hypothetical protein B7X06_04560 [Verrucomicrobia bacterium 21-51-4]